MLKRKDTALAHDKSPKSEKAGPQVLSRAAANLSPPRQSLLVRSHSELNLSQILHSRDELSLAPEDKSQEPLLSSQLVSPISSVSSVDSPLSKDHSEQAQPGNLTSWFSSGLWVNGNPKSSTLFREGGPSVARFAIHSEQKKHAHQKFKRSSQTASHSSYSLSALSEESVGGSAVKSETKHLRSFSFFAEDITESNKIPTVKPKRYQNPASYPDLHDNDGNKLELSLPSLEERKAKFS